MAKKQKRRVFACDFTEGKDLVSLLQPL